MQKTKKECIGCKYYNANIDWCDLLEHWGATCPKWNDKQI